MLYLPLGFWGFQVNLKTQEQKSVHTCRNAEGHPRGVFYTQTDPDTGMVAHCCRLVEELEAAGKRPAPSPVCTAAQGTDNMPRPGGHPRANSTSTLRRCWNATLTPVGFFGSRLRAENDSHSRPASSLQGPLHPNLTVYDLSSRFERKVTPLKE